jgi:adenylate cyclase
MTDRKIKRKLTTIFCADVQSYSSLMAKDEADTLERLRRYRGIMNDLFERHDGRKVNTWGDAVIAEFPSVVEAVRCGVEIQDAIGAENRDLPQSSQMWFRIGINLGDVMISSGDLFGDGVNVAARLQALAEPGGILVSGQVHDLVQDKLAVGFGFLGGKTVKNIAKEVPVYRVLLKPDDAHPLPPQPAAAFIAGPSGESSFQHDLIVNGGRAALIIAILFAINIFAGADTWWFQWPALPIIAIFGLRMLSLYQKRLRRRS